MNPPSPAAPVQALAGTLSPTATLEVAAVFAVVYLGMVLGGLPRLKLDRTGVALLGAIAMLGLKVLTPEEAARAIHLPTLLLLFSFMVLSAQMRLAGFYAALTRATVASGWSGGALLAAVIALAAALSAVFSNDVVCLAMAPVLIDALRGRGLSPMPFLLGLACAANIGSALTLIGNPQNMLIGEMLALPFGAYAAVAAAPVLASLLALWLLLRPALAVPAEPPGAPPPAPDDTELDRWQAAKGLAVATVLMAVFLFTDAARDVAALVGAGVLLLSQRFHSSRVMALVDWELLVLFMGLFIVNAAFERTGLALQALQALAAAGLSLAEPATLLLATVGLSNLVSNVPAVMLLLPALPPGAAGQQAGVGMALASTFAGNLLLVGSIANLIVADAAQARGLRLDWRSHARVGLPVTLASLLTLGLAQALGGLRLS